jgi:hypothetical protein
MEREGRIYPDDDGESKLVRVKSAIRIESSSLFTRSPLF